MFNHACNPNVVKLATRHGSEIRALRQIQEGEEVCISYLNPWMQSEGRR